VVEGGGGVGGGGGGVARGRVAAAWGRQQGGGGGAPAGGVAEARYTSCAPPATGGWRRGSPKHDTRVVYRQRLAVGGGGRWREAEAWARWKEAAGR